MDGCPFISYLYVNVRQPACNSLHEMMLKPPALDECGWYILRLLKQMAAVIMYDEILLCVREGSKQATST